MKGELGSFNYNALQKEINEIVDQNESWIIEIRRHLHQYPELSHKETRTVQFIREKLVSLGLHPWTCTGKDVMATIEGGLPGKTIVLRADTDALPIKEETGLPFASKHEGVMHACGHDGHSAALLGAAQAFMTLNKPFPGKIILLFQHAEEVVPGGACEIVETNALDEADGIFGFHLWKNLESGKIGTVPGAIMAGSDFFTIEIEGKGGHGSMPHLSVDPIVIASHVVTQLQSVVSRMVNPLHPAVISVGKITAGEGYNIIPETAEIQGTVRYFQEDVQEQIMNRIERLVQGTCASFGAKGRLIYVKGDPAVINHPGMNQIVEEVGREIVQAENVVPAPISMAGEDFSYYLKKIPGAYFFIGIGGGEESCFGHHHPKFTINEEMIAVGSKLFAGIALKYLLTK